MLQQVVTKYENATIKFQRIILIIFKKRGNILYRSIKDILLSLEIKWECVFL